MKTLISFPLTLFVLLSPSLSWAFWFKTATVQRCDPEETHICVTVELPNNLNSFEEQSFTFHFPANIKVENVKVSLWMHMDCGKRSHPGAPVTLEQIDKTKFLVHNAHFFMIGSWEIVLNFEKQKQYEIRIPVDINQ
jgi:hypothetical protein